MPYSAASMQGLHLTADLHHCQCAMQRFTDAPALAAACLEAVRASGLRAVGQLFHAFPGVDGAPSGVTATLLLAESHLCVHTWPEQRAATLDVYVCNYGADHSAKAHALLNALAALFEPGHIEHHQLRRGDLAAASVQAAQPGSQAQWRAASPAPAASTPSNSRLPSTPSPP